MPEPQSPEIKISENPLIQAQVDQKIEDLSSLKRNQGKSPQELNSQARSQVATEIWIKKIRNMFGKKLQSTEQRAEAAEENSMYDANTGLRSRRWLDERVNNAIREANRTGKNFFVYLMDVDDFKIYNARFGHPGGDAVLRLPKLVKTRPNEDIARYGGDENVQVLNDDIELEEAVSVAARNSQFITSESEKLIKDLPIIDQGTPNISRVTISVGLVQYRPGMSIEDLYSEASELMYESKSQGKDGISVKTSDEAIQYFNRQGEQIRTNPQPANIT